MGLMMLDPIIDSVLDAHKRSLEADLRRIDIQLRRRPEDIALRAEFVKRNNMLCRFNLAVMRLKGGQPWSLPSTPGA